MNKNLLKTAVIVLSFLGFMSLVAVLILYFDQFGHLGYSDKQQDWALFGDYLGGVLSGIFSFLTLLAVLYALYIQTDRLDKTIELTEENLQTTKKELEEANKVQQSQYEALRVQNFENSFFKLLEFLFTSRQKIKYDDKILGDVAFQNHFYSLSGSIEYESDDPLTAVGHFFQNQGALAAHMRIYEQLISYIKATGFKEDTEVKYAKMIITGAYVSELTLLMHYCFTSEETFLKEMIEKGALLESIPVNEGGDFFFIDESLYRCIDYQAFGVKEPDMLITTNEDVFIRTDF